MARERPRERLARRRCRAGKRLELADEVGLVGVTAARGEIRPFRGGIPARERSTFWNRAIRERLLGERPTPSANSRSSWRRLQPTRSATAADAEAGPVVRETSIHGRTAICGARRASASRRLLEKPPTRARRAPRPPGVPTASWARRPSPSQASSDVGNAVRERGSAAAEALAPRPAGSGRPASRPDRWERSQGARRRAREKAGGLRTLREPEAAKGLAEVEDPLQAAIGRRPARAATRRGVPARRRSRSTRCAPRAPGRPDARSTLMRPERGAAGGARSSRGGRAGSPASGCRRAPRRSGATGRDRCPSHRASS